MRAAGRIALVVSLLLAPLPAAAQVHHRLDVRLAPAAGTLAVTDVVSLEESGGETVFLLHAGLAPALEAPVDATLRRLDAARGPGGVPLERYAVSLPPGAHGFTLRYAGEIRHEVRSASQEYARSFGATPGLVGADGVFLGAASHWYPALGEQPVTFDMTVTLPAGWRSMSQGRREREQAPDGSVRESWRMADPQQSVDLVAGEFTEYSRPAGAVEALVLLREPDPALASRYLEATGLYLETYRKLVGPYPYSKFALVENFWETGYGMPSFTLLGPRVLRLPFILHSSFPHEILHCWFGNGVYVDYASGNWAEGLTSYLADHLVKEQRGQGAEYRHETLQKYADYVREEGDFALRQFRARHGAVTQAVGYGKTLMLFHMLRRQLGDERFVAGLQRFYREHEFRVAGFDDLRDSFAAAAGEPLDDFFAQWVEQAGAPALRVRDAAVRRAGEGYVLAATLEQAQAGPPYVLDVPLAVQLEGMHAAHQQTVRLEGRQRRLEIALEAAPLRLDVDPEFDLFRRLDRAETPPALSQALGDTRVLFVLPADAPEAVRRGYEMLVQNWRRGRPGDFAVTTDAALDELPADRSVWLFGWRNRWRPTLDAALAGYDYRAGESVVTVGGERLARANDVVVAVGRRAGSEQHALAWVANDNPAAMPGLARKLPHYGKYGFLGFRGDEPDNVARGQWPVLGSPMSVALSASAADGGGELAVRAPLIEPPALFSAGRMMADVRSLADPALEGRGLGSEGLARATALVERRFGELGLEPAGDTQGGYRQTWSAELGAPLGRVALANVVAVLPGTREDWRAQSVVVGAHLDHLGRGWPDVRAGNEGEVHPGADDNASGVAVMLELARVLAKRGPQPRAVVFAAFTGEEAGTLGSRHYLRAARRYPAEGVIGMVNLDAVGRLGDRKLLVIGAGSAREWQHVFRGAGFVTGVPVEPVAEPLDASDHAAFAESGLPAVQLTSGPHADYHRPGDVADRVDGAGLAKVAAVLDEAVMYLASREQPLTVSGAVGNGGGEGAGRRRVSLGTVPEFGDRGAGVLLAGVVDGSPAERAGLRGGDVIVGVDGREIADLRAFTDVLRALEPGARITVRFLRDGEERSAVATVVRR